MVLSAVAKDLDLDCRWFSLSLSPSLPSLAEAQLFDGDTPTVNFCPGLYCTCLQVLTFDLEEKSDGSP